MLLKALFPLLQRSAAGALLAVGLLASATAMAQEPETTSNKEERAVEAEAEPAPAKKKAERTRRVIKTLQRKNFLKIGRFEAAPQLGFVTNDPFINRFILGASVTYHPTEVFGIELQGGWSPDFEKRDWKGVTTQLVEKNRVSPDISKLSWYTNANFQFTPINGKFAVGNRAIINFDVFGIFGTGRAATNDDLEAINAEDNEQDALATERQIHVTTNIGGGFRFIFTKAIAARLEGRSMIYIETISSTKLEMKNNFLLLGSVSFFFPNMD